MSITTDSNITATPVRISRGSRPGWRQTAVRFRAGVITSGAPSAPTAPTSTAFEQLTLFDTAAYAKGVK